ncbi:hypothetical protein [Streptomyces sp. NPDC056683]|uniref:hypothetical protein n=1 Tax=Streptomyces sp. NPDC056683 TaxID=3345910 RepID=UPI0036CFAEBB
MGERSGIGFLPWSNVSTAHDGLRLVEAAGRPAGGVIIDVWRTERMDGPDLALPGGTVRATGRAGTEVPSRPGLHGGSVVSR